MSVLMGTKVFPHYMYIHYLELQNHAFDDCDMEMWRRGRRNRKRMNIRIVQVYIYKGFGISRYVETEFAQCMILVLKLITKS